MDHNKLYTMFGFYENELKANILHYWLKRCEDREYGGFVNCYTNDGKELFSYDKFTWSQGRFVWMFAKLADTEAPVFDKEEREKLLSLARQGAYFLMEHCLMGEDDWRCVFLMERDGTPKEVEPGAPLDMSIYADCFVIAGVGMYAAASGDMKAYRFAKRLYDSAVDRVERDEFNTLPYPLDRKYRAHGIPMIFSNVSRELYRAAERLAPSDAPLLLRNMEKYTGDTLTHFVDENNVIHEVITKDNHFFPQILGQNMNPGHTIEDVWFMLDTVDFTGRTDWEPLIYAIAKKALENGWDEEFGGIIHYAGIHGGKPEGDMTGVEKETMVKQLEDWDYKLWWVHTEALYSTLRLGFRTGDQVFFDWYERIFDYVFRTFPNPDREIREWIQICDRTGRGEWKVVGLPVKDPYHITRNLILIIELLYRELQRGE